MARREKIARGNPLPILAMRASIAALAISLVLFVTEWLRMAGVSLMVLAALALTSLVAWDEATSGFSNPAVITVWAEFILSAGLTRAGVSDVIGRNGLREAGSGEARLNRAGCASCSNG